MLTVSSRWIWIFWKGPAEAVAIDRMGAMMMRSRRRAREEEKEKRAVGEEEEEINDALLRNIIAAAAAAAAAVAILVSVDYNNMFYIFLVGRKDLLHDDLELSR